MSDKKSRSIADIQQDYQNLCLKAGHLQYQVYTHERDLELVNSELRDLNLEAAAVKAEEDKAAAEANKNVVNMPLAENQSSAV